MALSFLYLMTRRLGDMLLGSLRTERAKDVEIAVLRHQLEVLRRQVKRPEFRPTDRAILAVLRLPCPYGLSALPARRRRRVIAPTTTGHIAIKTLGRSDALAPRPDSVWDHELTGPRASGEESGGILPRP
jgi:hypothetical protein